MDASLRTKIMDSFLVVILAMRVVGWAGIAEISSHRATMGAMIQTEVKAALDVDRVNADYLRLNHAALLRGDAAPAGRGPVPRPAPATRAAGAPGPRPELRVAGRRQRLAQSQRTRRRPLRRRHVPEVGHGSTINNAC